MSKETEPTVQQSISGAFNDESTSDLKIVADGKVIHVHRAILKIRSVCCKEWVGQKETILIIDRCEYFRRMFQSHWDESSQDKVEIIGYSYPVVHSFLKWLYSDVLELPPEDAIGEWSDCFARCSDVQLMVSSPSQMPALSYCNMPVWQVKLLPQLRTIA